MSLKKILVISIILLILVVGFLVVYNFFLKEEITPSVTPSATTTPTTSLTGPIKAISQEPVLDPIIDGQKVKYYLKNNGYVFESTFESFLVVK